MIDFQDVINRVKQILSQQTQTPKILDRDIAKALSLTPAYFAVIKKRQKIPYMHLALFCHKHHISMNWILMAQNPQYLT